MSKKHLYAAGAIAAGLAALYFLTRAAKPAAPAPSTPGLTFVPGLGYVPTGNSLVPDGSQVVSGNVTEGEGLTITGSFYN